MQFVQLRPYNYRCAVFVTDGEILHMYAIKFSWEISLLMAGCWNFSWDIKENIEGSGYSTNQVTIVHEIGSFGAGCLQDHLQGRANSPESKDDKESSGDIIWCQR